jgi:hypothetical protein
MLTHKRALGAIVLSCAIAASGAYAQAPAPTPRPAPAAKSEPSKVSQTSDEVKAWSRRKWNAAKVEYAKDTAKWTVCRKRAKDKKLSGRASWSFLYDCMKS